MPTPSHPARKLAAGLTLGAVLAAGAAGCCAFSTAPRDVPLDARTAGVRAAIASAWGEHIAAAMAEDAAAASALYAEDAVYVVPGSRTLHGRAAIEAMDARSMAEADVLEATHHTEALRVDGDLAWEIGTVIGPVRPVGGEARVVSWRYAALWSRQPDGAWRIASIAGRG